MRAVRRPWLLRLLGLAIVAVAVHLAAVWALPRVIMWRLMSTAPSTLPTESGVVLPPMTDHTQRRVVMPSPDLLYAICSYDLAARPLRLRADPKLPTYWSIALYAANSDNFFVLNDRQAGARPVDLLLVGPGGSAPADGAEGSRVVSAPSARGLVLMRVLVPDPARGLGAAEAGRRSLRCEPA
jgi:uncharacterized membrane protein